MLLLACGRGAVTETKEGRVQFVALLLLMAEAL